MSRRRLRNVQRQIRDPNFSNTVLLLQGEGTQGANNNTFRDSSSNNFAITRNGNVSQGTFSPHGTLWSNYFDGTGDSLAISDNTTLQLSDSVCTVEAWVFITSYTGTFANIISKFSYGATPPSTRNGWYFVINSTSSANDFLIFRAETNGTITTNIQASVTMALNTWYHVAFTNDGTTRRLFVNGVSQTLAASTYASWTDVTAATDLGSIKTTLYFPGYISNCRIVKGTALYTDNFTPPAQPLVAIANTQLLTCQSNRFIDNSSNNFAVARNGDVTVQRFSPFNPSSEYSTNAIGGSGLFDGTGDYLTLADNTNLEVPTQDFTVEYYMYLNALPASGSGYTTYQKGLVANSNFEYTFGFTNAAGTPRLQAGYKTTGDTNPATLLNATSGDITPGQWYHVAFTRVGTALNFWLNGVSAGTAVWPATTFAGAGQASIGANIIAASNFNGYISDLRLTKGTALYTAAFTPPSTPLTAGVNTQLLCNFTNAGVFDNTMNHVLETTGNAQITTTQARFGTGSLSFDGVFGTRIDVPASPLLVMGTSDFTVDGWFRIPAAMSGAIFNIVPSTTLDANTSTTAIGVFTSTSGGSDRRLGMVAYNLNVLGSTTDYTLNTWHHFAYVRQGAATWLTLDGRRITSLFNLDGAFNYTGSRIYIGAGFIGTWNGQVDGLRVTPGVARYPGGSGSPGTQLFAPPARSYPNN